MKLKSLVWTLGMRPAPVRYGTSRLRFELPRDGEIEFAKWEHPKDYFRPFDQELVDNLRRFISPGDTVLDIGAHSGDFTVPMALAAGATGWVFAFEPNPYVFDVLAENSLLNLDRTQIVPVRAAAACEEGTLEFKYSDPGYCNGGRFEAISRWRHGHPFTLQVQAVRTAEWIETRFPGRLAKTSFVKVDTEGAELEVVESLREVIATARPVLHLEMYRHSPAPRRLALFDTLGRHGYTVYRTDDGYGCRPGQKLAAEDLMRWPHYDVLALPA